MREEARAIQQRIEQLKQQNHRLSNELDYLHSDQYIEKAAREHLGLVRPGDVAVIIASPNDNKDQMPVPAPTPTPSPTPVPQRQDVPNWQKWLSLFSGQD